MEWISVNKTLPKNTFMCAVVMFNKFSSEYEYGTGIYDNKSGWEVGTNLGESYEVIDWVKLPLKK